LYKKGKSSRKSFYVQIGFLSIILFSISGLLGILPFQKNIYVKKQTEILTGKSFWSSEVFSFEEISVRGEGYSIDAFKYGDEVSDYFENPDHFFFNSYPKEMEYRKNWKREKWKKTPVSNEEQKFLNHATPSYGDWNEFKINKMKFVKEIANKEGAFYSYNFKDEGYVDFFIISPKENLIILINHNI